MKKYNLLKVLAITVVIAWLLTLFIPGSYAGYSGKVTTNSIAAVGIWSLLSNLSVSISYFNGIAVFLIAVACFYAVMSKIEVYNKFVKKVASIFENKIALLVLIIIILIFTGGISIPLILIIMLGFRNPKGLLVSITIIIFGILASVVNEPLILIAFMPFIYKVMKELDIDKKVILSSTIVATLVGAMCGIYNSTLFSTFSLSVNTLLLVKVILLVVLLAILILFVAPREDKSKENKQVKKEEKSDKVVAAKKITTSKSTTKKATNRKKVAK